MPLFSRPRDAQRLQQPDNAPGRPAAHRPPRTCRGFYGPAGSILLTADGTPVDGSQIYAANLVRPARRLVVHRRLRQDRHRPRARAHPVRRRRPAAAVPAAHLPVRLPCRNRRRALRPLPRTDPARPRDRATSSRSSARPTSPPSKARSPAGTSCAAGSSGIIVLPGFESLTIDLTGAPAIQLPAGQQPVHRRRGADHRRRPARRDLEQLPRHADRRHRSHRRGRAACHPQATRTPAGQLLISGVWIAGQLHRDRRQFR